MAYLVWFGFCSFVHHVCSFWSCACSYCCEQERGERESHFPGDARQLPNAGRICTPHVSVLPIPHSLWMREVVKEATCWLIASQFLPSLQHFSARTNNAWLICMCLERQRGSPKSGMLNTGACACELMCSDHPWRMHERIQPPFLPPAL